MRHIIVRKTGGPSCLLLESAPDPEPSEGCVRIAVQTIGINFADILVRQGLYNDVPGYPIVPGYEIAGVVDQVGENVDSDWLGQNVFGLTFFGGYAEKVCLPVEHIFQKPNEISFEVACGLPTTYATAWQLLVVMGALKPQERVLIHNAGGGVGLAAVDLARNIGATIYGTASQRKHEQLQARGLSHPIDYNTQDWEQTFATMTGGRGAHLILDPLGGRSFRKSYRALAPTGRLGMFGISEASHSGFWGRVKLLGTALSMPFFHPVSLMNGNKAVFGVNLARLAADPPMMRSWIDAILDLTKQGKLHPEVDRAFSFEKAHEAHEYIETRRNFGKVVLKI
ncbi:zinc-binding dehydrogenase [Oligoflexus tunisiensis]|uniref:zinc-binding dehydrogenase n=1 Tax=Oligoflexus tunisiensis TaxID=708132 RepID=UPI00114D12BB|nr:zinc-binding dehydrogenase [Oligoflexus tunisiensis]